MRITAKGAPVANPADVKHAPASRTRLAEALCGARTGTREDAWNYVTCPDCKTA